MLVQVLVAKSDPELVIVLVQVLVAKSDPELVIVLVQVLLEPVQELAVDL